LKKLSTYLFVSFLFIQGIIYAQKTDIQLAKEYAAREEYDKAETVFEKLFKSSNTQNMVYQDLYSVYINQKKYDKAESITKVVIKKNPTEILYKVNLLSVLEFQKNTKEYAKQLEKFNKDYGSDEVTCKAAIDVLNTKSRYDLSQLLINYFRNKTKQPQAFVFEQITVYEFTKNNESLINELLIVLKTGIENNTYVQNRLQNNLSEQKDFDYLENILIKSVQDQPDIIEYSELLIWLYIQQKRFNLAFIQVKAIDKRVFRNGQKVYELADIAFKNKDYKNTIKILEYNIENYKNTFIYQPSRNLMVKAKEENVKATYPIQQEQILSLINDYKGIINEFGRSHQSAEAMRNMALLYAVYLGKTDTAIVILNQAIAMPNPDKSFIDRAKIDLGDLYILNDEPWESVLIYGQVEKSQKDQPLGYEAKLRNAKLSYYKGEFLWAQDQLDVLKLATTREIANDAISLSLLIQDNLGEDSITTPLEMYAQAELLIFKHQYEDAIGKLNAILIGFPKHSIADDIYFQKAKIYIKTAQYDNAISELNKIIANHITDIYGDDAYFMKAEIFDYNKNDSIMAMQLYQEFLDKFPGSVFVAEARKRFRILRGDRL
jgi:tetratricopeptide (TPR) repeat protein